MLSRTGMDDRFTQVAKLPWWEAAGARNQGGATKLPWREAAGARPRPTFCFYMQICQWALAVRFSFGLRSTAYRPA